MNADDFFAVLQGHAAGAPAVTPATGCADTSYAELLSRTEALAARLQRERVAVLASRLDNGTGWIIADLAALRAGVVHVPMPGFFSEPQQRHVLRAAGADALLTESPADGSWELARLDSRPAAVPATTAKITFTSGTTGTPKGVCLDAGAMLEVAHGIAAATAGLPIERHLCALPLPILLENIAGVLAPLLRGANVIAPPLDRVGLAGSSSFDPARLDDAVRRFRCQSLILLPQMLRAWTRWLQARGSTAPDSLTLVAVGGAMVGPATILSARAVGLPAFEGYGLSEGASVQTLNLPGADRAGSAGRLLPHARLRLANDGEIEIGGPLFLGYVGEDARCADLLAAQGRVKWWRTGDLGEIDSEGFVHVRGRRDAVLVTAFGRNVSPEWVESTLQSNPAIERAVVLGDGGPALGAVLWPAGEAGNGGAARLAAAVAEANARLPDYARVHRWVLARHAFSPVSGMATVNGRPRRAAVAGAYRNELFMNVEP